MVSVFKGRYYDDLFKWEGTEGSIRKTKERLIENVTLVGIGIETESMFKMYLPIGNMTKIENIFIDIERYKITF